MGLHIAITSKHQKCPTNRQTRLSSQNTVLTLILNKLSLKWYPTLLKT
uniref:Uncharacterized protein n=1 Tax=Rhizophora mucronata TaxID=61149 RepID=A0A2P2NV55_RHIMU